MNQELQKLFKEIVGVQGKDPSPYLYDKWLKLCDKHELQTVVKAWDDIAENCDSWKYYELNVWKSKLEYYEPRKVEADNKTEYIKNCRKTKQWSNEDKANWNENSRKWEEKEQTYREYLENAKKIGQMNETDAAKEMIRYERLGKSLDEYNKSDLMKGVKI